MVIMSTQKKSFSIYGSNDIKILPTIVIGILICGIVWSLKQLNYQPWALGSVDFYKA